MLSPEIIPAVHDDGSLNEAVIHSTRYQAAGFVFDRANGLGNVPDVENIAYMGFVAFMRPQTYLSYVGEGFRRQTVDYVLAENPVLSPSFLIIRMDDTGKCRVVGHEGRARMTAVSERNPEAIVPVAVFLQEGYFSLRNRHLEPAMFDRLREGLWSQQSETVASVWVPGEPFVGLVYENEQGKVVCLDYQDRPAANLDI
jgi:hypothetical protein